MIKKAKELNVALKENETIKEYLTLKKSLKENEDINNLLNEILSVQATLKESVKDNNIKSINECKKKIDILKEKFFSNPLIVNYMSLKDESLRIIEQVSKIIGD